MINILLLAILIVGFTPRTYPNKPPGTPKMIYWKGIWEPRTYGEFQLGYWHKDSFNISWIVHHSEPDGGYPYHYGYVWGINDTIKVRIYLNNRLPYDKIMISDSPQDWFYPVLYDPMVDVFKTKPLADTSAFSYRFEHWVKMRDNQMIVKPDTI